MPITSTARVKGYVQGAGYGRSEIETSPLTNAAAVPTLLEIVLASGANTIPVPAGSKAVIITCDPSSTRVKTLKGVAGDTGIPIASSGRGGSMLLKFTTAVTSFVINSSGADTGIITRFQFI